MCVVHVHVYIHVIAFFVVGKMYIHTSLMGHTANVLIAHVRDL